MKNPGIIFLLFGLINIETSSLIAQEFDCRGSHTPYWLHSNNIRASFFPRGNKFTNEDIEGQFLVPFNLQSRLSTIFASSPWVGGFDDAGNLKIAFETYPPANHENNNYSVGPLSSIGTFYDTICTHYDRAWSVYAEDIEAHRLDYYTDFKIDDTIASIFQWPARGNKHFKRYYGFDLPFDNLGLAPFRDMNSNEVYDPENGDYPIVFPLQTLEYIPDQILWMVFNDLSSWDERPLRFEIQLTAFAYHCQENSWLNNTIFNKYRIISKAVTSVDSVFFGFWTDYDLGCHEDDFVGSDSIRNTEFVYNDNNGDGNPGIDCPGGTETYGVNPPVQSMTYLSHPMHSFIAAGNENEPIEFYRKLSGHWNDNTPIYPSGEGYDPGSSLPPTRFLFNGDPRNENSWSGKNVLSKGKEYKTVSSVNLGRMDPGARRDIIIAYQFHHHPDSNYNGQLSLMYNNIDSLLNTQYYGENCSPFPYCTGDDCVWPGDFNRDGIADHFDLLHWGLMKDQTGPAREGKLSWRKQYGANWDFSSMDGVNFKHGDGDGNGSINGDDLSVNIFNFLMANENYIHEVKYPVGDEIVITSMPIDQAGNIKRLLISANEDISNVFGLAFDLEFDTSYFYITPGIIQIKCPDSTTCYGENEYSAIQSITEYGLRYAFVQNDHQSQLIPENFSFEFFFTGLKLKDGITLDQLPDSTVIRLRNLVAIDEYGNDLQIGSNQLVLYNPLTTSVLEPNSFIRVYPNPAGDFIFIGVDQQVKIQFFDLQGRLSKALSADSNQKIDLTDLTNGVYIVRIPEYGLVTRIIVQHQ